MAIEANTLEELTKVLRERGLRLVAEVKFTRAPYRKNHKWFCVID